MGSTIGHKIDYNVVCYTAVFSVVTQRSCVPGSSYIYDSEGSVALSLGLITLGGQCVSGHVVRARLGYATQMS